MQLPAEVLLSDAVTVATTDGYVDVKYCGKQASCILHILCA